MNETDWLWDEPFGNPEAEDIGPPLSEADVAAWEQRHAVRLPPVMRRAYLQQNGGRVRGSDRGAALVQLANVEPVPPDDLDMLYPSDALDRVRRGRLFDAGYDDTSANLLLHDPDGDGPPALYACYYDGGSVEPLADPADGLFGGRAK